jgi:hypothetical protein
LSYLRLEELLTNTNRTCKAFNNIITTTSYLWREFEFDNPVHFYKGTLERIFQHSRKFESFIIPASGYSYLAPDIDFLFSKHFQGNKLYWLNISQCPISTLCFLKQCLNLQILSVDGCKNLVDEDFLAIRYCNKIDQLYVSFTRISPNTIIKILEQNQLIVLDACGVQFSLEQCSAVMETSKSLLFFHLSLRDESSEIRAQFKREFIDIYRNCNFHLYKNESQ